VGPASLLASATKGTAFEPSRRRSWPEAGAATAANVHAASPTMASRVQIEVLIGSLLAFSTLFSLRRELIRAEHPRNR
jgi:hypothetical protein